MDVMPDGQSSHCVKESSLVQSRTFSYTDPLWMRNVDLPATEGNAPIEFVPHAGTFGYALGLQCGESPKQDREYEVGQSSQRLLTS